MFIFLTVKISPPAFLALYNFGALIVKRGERFCLLACSRADVLLLVIQASYKNNFSGSCCFQTLLLALRTLPLTGENVCDFFNKC